MLLITPYLAFSLVLHLKLLIILSFPRHSADTKPVVCFATLALLAHLSESIQAVRKDPVRMPSRKQDLLSTKMITR